MTDSPRPTLHPDPHRVTSQEALSALYNPPSALVMNKVAKRVDPRTAAFIAASPFCLLSTSGARGPHCTPRGDAPGFITVLDEKTLALPDRRGNNRLDALRDILDNPALALLFLVPGMGETLRIGGLGHITTDPALRERHAVQGQTPATVLLVEVREVYMQCARAIARSKLWAGRAKPEAAPSGGELLAAHTGGLVDAKDFDETRAPQIIATLY
ncbi:pyridoxamine 5'-phosphate oxidase family protein [Roseomonas sp. GC11]|uniref:MSMEG_1061 family FMN-dependent PPOX-type flavoprotein n=1 Tax=Roseomonas sp. GC11 TaxID=2950546 RepID=UPI00210BB50F|nr:MSMEG_1061 family FMN-dependent PPOX-type flavoprotein [Roseomonas sp. GC11]MCQ4158459.1 pyridoxamine 5'-phosphate oxidase family protein [Roseomonas sp. GC11]